MKKSLLILSLHAIVILSLQAQSISNFIYKLDNGINVKTEHCWNQVWIQQSYSPIAANDQIPLAVNIRALGDLIAGSSYNLQSAGKEIKMKGAAPGTYDLKMVFKLSGKPGIMSFLVGNILIKPKTKTSVNVTLYNYQIRIDESPVSLSGLSSFETIIDKCKGNTAEDTYFGIPVFYTKGKHDQPVPANETISKTKGNIKSGIYDLLISIGISGQTHKIWLENFQMKPDISYKITTNLNAGGVIYTGGNKEIKELHLYPAGTATSQTGTPAPVKNLETISYNNITIAHCCSPGAYDVLLDYGNGTRYEWRKNIAVVTGSKTEVK
jgi:hypothetical protein